MAVQSLEPALSYLLEEDILLSVVVNGFRAYRMVFLAKIAPQSPALGKFPVCDPVHKMMFVEVIMWEFCRCLEAAQEALAVLLPADLLASQMISWILC